MPGPAYTTLEDIAKTIAEDAGINSGSSPQSEFTDYGPIKAARRAGPPSVAWTVLGAKWEPAEQDEHVQTRACNQRVMRCRVEFLATDFDACMLLVSDFGAAVFRTQSRTSVRVVDEDHVPQPVASSARYQITLTVEYDLPVVYETDDVAEVEATAQTGTLTETE